MTQPANEVQLTIAVILGQSHPAIKQNIRLVTQHIGEALTRPAGATPDEQERSQLAEQLGLPQDVPFRLVVRAIKPRGHTAK